MPLPHARTGTFGHLRVYCHGATDLPAADFTDSKALATSDPYMTVFLMNHDTRRRSQVHKTRTKQRTLKPVWRDEFWFLLRECPWRLDIHFEVFDYDRLKEDDFLGEAKLLLDAGLLKEAQRSPIVRELQLQHDPMRSKVPASGTVRIELSWHPSPTFEGQHDEDARVVTLVLRSPHLYRAAGLAMLGMAGLLLLIAQNMRWLCRGRSLPACHTVDVSGAGRCALVGALCAFAAFAVHLHAYAGVCGAGWQGHPPTLVELAEAAAERDEQLEARARNPQGLAMKVSAASATQFKLSVGGPPMPKMSLAVVRLVTWCLHLAALALSSLAAALAWLEDGPPGILGEAAYLVAGAALCLVLSMAAYVRERVIWKEARARHIQLQHQRHGSNLAEPLLDEEFREEQTLPAQPATDACNVGSCSRQQTLPAQPATDVCDAASCSRHEGPAGRAAKAVQIEFLEPQERALSRGSRYCCGAGI